MMESSTYIKVPGQPVICEAHNIVLAIRNVCETKHVIHNFCEVIYVKLKICVATSFYHLLSEHFFSLRWKSDAW